MPMREEDQFPMHSQSAALLPVVHLTDEQFTDLLLGAIPPAVIAHLQACSRCSDEAQRAAGAIGSFAQQSRLWAEHRVASRTPARRTPLVWLGVPIAPVAWVATTVALAAGIGIAHLAERRAVAPQPVAAVRAVPAAVSPATLKTDNELLSAIDGELSDTDISGAKTYGLTSDRHPARLRSAKGISN